MITPGCRRLHVRPDRSSTYCLTTVRALRAAGDGFPRARVPLAEVLARGDYRPSLYAGNAAAYGATGLLNRWNTLVGYSVTTVACSVLGLQRRGSRAPRQRSISTRAILANLVWGALAPPSRFRGHLVIPKGVLNTPGNVAQRMDKTTALGIDGDGTFVCPQFAGSAPEPRRNAERYPVLLKSMRGGCAPECLYEPPERL